MKPRTPDSKRRSADSVQGHRRRFAASLVWAALIAAGADAWAQSPAASLQPGHPRRTGTFQNPRVIGGGRRGGVPLQAPLAATIDSEEDDSLAWLANPVPAGLAASTEVLPRPGTSPPIAVSRMQANVLWTFNPGSPETEFYAADSLGQDLGTFEITGVNNVSWQAIAEGPCGARTCLYLGDLGDQTERRSSVTLYRLEEPLISRDRLPRTYAVVRVDSLAFRYPDGPRDAQAMYLAKDGTVYLVTTGRTRGVTAYRVPAMAWLGRPWTVADSIGTLATQKVRRMGAVAGAAISPDGRTIALRTPHAVLFFPAGPRGEPEVGTAPTICDLSRFQVLGLGLSWLTDDLLVLSVMQGPAPAGAIIFVTCAR